MKTKFYVPILKAKFGEFQALAKLSTKVSPYISPLIEITKISWDHDENSLPPNMQDHLNRTAKKFIDYWAREQAFIDMTQIADERADGISTIEYFYKRLFEKGLTPPPVFRLNSPALLMEGIRNIQQKYEFEYAALRITLTDLSSPQLKTTLDRVIIDQLGTPPKIHIIIDLASPENFDDLDALTEAIVTRLEDFPYFQNWASVSICSSAYPDAEFIKKDINYIPRRDWRLYQQILIELSGKSFNRDINYGDYSIVKPGHFDFNPIQMNSSAKMIYTTPNEYVFLKGKSLKHKGYRQYIEQASEIVNADYYLGEHFSAGDWQLNRCCINQDKTGTATTWIWVGNNHHMTMVVRDLFASPSAA